MDSEDILHNLSDRQTFIIH